MQAQFVKETLGRFWGRRTSETSLTSEAATAPPHAYGSAATDRFIWLFGLGSPFWFFTICPFGPISHSEMSHFGRFTIGQFPDLPSTVGLGVRLKTGQLGFGASWKLPNSTDCVLGISRSCPFRSLPFLDFGHFDHLDISHLAHRTHRTYLTQCKTWEKHSESSR